MEFKKIPDKEYFAIDALSNSGVKRLLKTPAHYKLETEKTEAMTLGSLVHCMILEPEEVEKRFAVAPICDRRTKAGKVEYALFVEASHGKEVISFEAFEQAKSVAGSVLNYQFYGIKFSQVVDDCQKEVACLWEQDFEGMKIPCKSKYDLVSEKHGIIFDIKTAQDASPDGFKRAMYNESLGYYIQSAFYRLPEITRGYKFCFIVVEKKPPFAVGMYYADESVMDEAHQKIKMAAELWNHGQNTGEWSNQFNHQPEELSAPGWFYTKQL